jgi:uncharacterized protein with von Willebrand factor type A (vWA) domain
VTRPFTVRTAVLDLPPLVAAFSRRLHDAGLPVEPERAARLARALRLVQPVARRRLYWTARAVLVADRAQAAVFDHVFAEVFGGAAAGDVLPALGTHEVPVPAGEERRAMKPSAPRDPDAPPEPMPAASAPARPAGGRDAAEREVLVPVLASAEEALRAMRFDALERDELRHIYQLMDELALATPRRRTRRAQRRRHGPRIDVRRTLRASLRTGGDPVRLARRHRRVVQRRLVLLCDISGSMEPYARAYLQFLSCAAMAGTRGRRSEAFVFATRLTRVTRALHERRPDRAIAQAAAAAPDWSSGTRIGEALKRFNDRHGRRGMARGAVIVILSDGWERGDPELVGREMQRLSRLAHRIVWVNPRVAAPGFSPRTGGMAAALPWCDALVSGHSLAALHDVVTAIGADHRELVAPSERWPAAVAGSAPDAADDEPWASAVPVAGSSVAMPSGYGPSRGRTTPGWDLH